jgi:hypothetical protein
MVHASHSKPHALHLILGTVMPARAYVGLNLDSKGLRLWGSTYCYCTSVYMDSFTPIFFQFAFTEKVLGKPNCGSYY